MHTRAFQAVKALIAADAFCAYPDHTQPFEIFTDSSDYQLGAAIFQKGKPVAYYSRKLTAAKKKYSTYEKELLAIYASLVTFLLLVQKLLCTLTRTIRIIPSITAVYCCIFCSL